MNNIIQFVCTHKYGISDAFRINDGGSIFINGKEHTLTYINDSHFLVDLKCYNSIDFYKKVVVMEHSIVLPGKGLVTHLYSPNWARYSDEHFCRVFIPTLKRSFLFNDLRIIPESLPLGMFKYEVREESGEPCQIKSRIKVDHFGSIISPTPLFDPREDSCIQISDFNFSYGPNEYMLELSHFCDENNITLTDNEELLYAIDSNEAYWLANARCEVA